MGQVREVDAAEALRLRPNAKKDAVKQRDTYYVIDDYDFHSIPNLRALIRTACRAVINTSGRSTERVKKVEARAQGSLVRRSDVSASRRYQPG
jgi:hypothetical protein